MKHLRRMAFAFTLMCVLAVSAFADSPEPPRCVPGETQGPPCANQSVGEEFTVLAETIGLPAEPDNLDLTGLAEIALQFLSLS